MLETAYPLLGLKLLGTICPCFEKKEDTPARHAAWAVRTIPIRWHRRPRPASNNSEAGVGSVSGFLSAFGAALGGAAAVAAGGGGGNLGGKKAIPLVGATLSIVDSPSGPRLIVLPPNNNDANNDVVGIRSKRIPLNMIKGVVRRPRGGIAVLDKKGVTLLRFDVLTTKKSYQTTQSMDDYDDKSMQGDEATAAVTAADYEDADEFRSENIIQHLNALVAWELRRRDYITTLGIDDDDNNVDEESTVDEYDDDDNTVNNNPRTGTSAGAAARSAKGMISAQAQKIQHFAQREMELQRLKKDRDTRKGKYVKEAGGMKYTAIAMANRS